MTPNDTPPASAEVRFTRAFEAHHRPLTAYARSRLRERQAADDAVADTFTTAWRRIDVMPGEPETRPWLFGVARNTIRNSRRTRRRGLRLAERLGSVRSDDVPAPQIDADPELAAALTVCSADEREMLLLVAWDGLSPSDVAEVFGISPNAARIRLHRARNKVAQALDPKRSSSSGHDPSTTPAHERKSTS